MLTSSPLSRERLRLWLGLIILATLPCYCLGLLAAYFAPDRRVPTPVPPVLSTLPPTAAKTGLPLPGFPTIPPLASPTLAGFVTASPESLPSATPTETASPTVSLTPTASATASVTPTATITPVPTDTLVPTRTLQPTESPTPEPLPSDTPASLNPNP